MTSRYRLRFETGERRGEEVPLDRFPARLGRRSTNEVQISDASVSGEHARLVLEGDRLSIHDCGSTNGTRLRGDRIETAVLTGGDVVSLGNVKLRLVDTEVIGAADDDEPALEGIDDVEGTDAPHDAVVPVEMAHTSVVGAEQIGERVGTVSADAVTRSARRSRAAAWAVPVLLAGAGWLVWKELGSGEGRRARTAAPPEVPGNLLAAGYSFEGVGEDGVAEARTWEAEGEPPVHFYGDAVWKRSGAFGLGVDLAAGEWAAARSPRVRVRPGRRLVAVAHASAEADAALRLGLRLSGGGARSDLVLWGAPVRGTAGFEELELALDVPPPFDRAEVLVGAGVPARGESRGETTGEAAPEGSPDATGLAYVDDVSLVEVEAAAAGAAFEEYRFLPGGAPAGTGFLVHIDRVLLGPVRAAPPGRGRAAFFAGEGEGRLGAEATETGMKLTVEGAAEGAVLTLSVHPELLAGGLATTGAGGYRAHALEFREDLATGVLLGSGLGLVRLAPAVGGPVRGRPTASGYELELPLPAASELEIQLSFTRDRGRALQAARRARDFESAGRAGAAMVAWGELLDNFPFEETLVREADQALARLVEEGTRRVREVRREVERARFFRLSELFRQYRAEALALQERYQGSEVARAAGALVAEIDSELASFEQEDAVRRSELLSSIADVLDAEGASELARHVRARGSAAPDGRR